MSRALSQQVGLPPSSPLRFSLAAANVRLFLGACGRHRVGLVLLIFVCLLAFLARGGLSQRTVRTGAADTLQHHESSAMNKEKVLITRTGSGADHSNRLLTKRSPAPANSPGCGKIVHVAATVQWRPGDPSGERGRAAALARSLVELTSHPVHLHLLVLTNPPEEFTSADEQALIEEVKRSTASRSQRTGENPSRLHCSVYRPNVSKRNSPFSGRLDERLTATETWNRLFVGFPSEAPGVIALSSSVTLTGDIWPMWNALVLEKTGQERYVGVQRRAVGARESRVAVIRFSDRRPGDVFRLAWQARRMDFKAIAKRTPSLPDWIGSTCTRLSSCIHLQCGSTGNPFIEGNPTAEALHLPSLFSAALQGCTRQRSNPTKESPSVAHFTKHTQISPHNADVALAERHKETLELSRRRCRRMADHVQHRPEVRLSFVDTDSRPESSGSMVDITLLAQGSLERLDRLEHICKSWLGPIDLALYTTEGEVHKLTNASIKQLCPRQRVRVHVVIKSIDFYPINFLRNLALHHALTKNVFLMDIDFVPSPGLPRKLLAWLSNSPRHRKGVLVVPAFELFEQPGKPSPELPQSKAQLLKLWSTGSVGSFHGEKFPPAHAPTNYARWVNAVQSYRVDWELHFEPYFAGEARRLPLYDEYLPYRFGNKAGHAMQLDAMGFEFHVATDAFLVHLPHAAPGPLSMKLAPCARLVQRDFINHLAQTYHADVKKYIGFAFPFSQWKKKAKSVV